MLFETIFDGRTSDQQALAENCRVPIAFVNGANDPIIDTDYIGGLSYATLWERHCFALRGEGHAVFLTNPTAVNAILERFTRDMTSQASNRRGATSRIVAA